MLRNVILELLHYLIKSVVVILLVVLVISVLASTAIQILCLKRDQKNQRPARNMEEYELRPSATTEK